VTGNTSRLRARLRVALVGASVLALVVALFSIPASASSSGEAASLSQCTNGMVSPLTPQPCVGSNTAAVSVTIAGINGGLAASYKNWVNGNANGSKAHWRETEFISYRTDISGITTLGPHTVVFSYDTVHSGKHALDYIGSYDSTETTSTQVTKDSNGDVIHANNNNPCADLVAASQMPSSQCTPATPGSFSTVAAPSENFGTGTGGETLCGGAPGPHSGSQVGGTIDLFGPATSSMSAAILPGADNVLSGTGQCTTSVKVTFTLSSLPASGQHVVLAWGGHISSQQDWGIGNSASFISGSPFHMSLISLDGASTGSQDRALATSAIFFTPTVSTIAGTGSGISCTTPITGTLAIGTQVCDTALLTGSSGANVVGTVAYNLYNSNTCTGNTPNGTLQFTNTQTVNSNGTVPNSAGFTVTSSGSYQWQAVFTSGSSLNLSATSPCGSETFTVGPNSPSLSTVAGTTATAPGSGSAGTCTSLGGSIAIGTNVCDTASLTTFATPVAGSVTYTLYFNGSNANSCPGNVPSGSNVFSDTQTVASDGTIPNSAAFTVANAGNYQWQAAFNSTNGQNNNATSACEPFTVSPNQPLMTTAQSLLPNDTATLSGATSTAGGSITFTLYVPNLANDCSSAVFFTETVPVSGNGPYSTSNKTFFATATGEWKWQVLYSGDANNQPTSSACGVENFTITNGS
jgi:hypothetical protein